MILIEEVVLQMKEEERDKENWIKKSPLSCDLHVIKNAHNLKPQEALQSSWVKRVLLRMVRIKASWSKRQRMFYVGYPHNLLVIIVSRASGNVDWADDDSLWRSILNYKHVKKLVWKGNVTPPVNLGRGYRCWMESSSSPVLQVHTEKAD